MAEHVIETQIIATGVSFDEYLEKYAADFCEYVEGTVIKLNPVSLRHAALSTYLLFLFSIYFKMRPVGQVLPAPFAMKLPAMTHGREPDLQIILKDNLVNLRDTYMDGPADICIEIVSPESISRDHGEKFQEYEKGGVGEYWIIDPIHEECRFYRLGGNQQYVPQSVDAAGNYTTPNLPQFRLHVPTLWNEELPDPIAITEAVKQMLT